MLDVVVEAAVRRVRSREEYWGYCSGFRRKAENQAKHDIDSKSSDLAFYVIQTLQ